MRSTRTSIIAAVLASAASAHVVLENPKPFKFVADGPTNPVSSTGADFPCKIPAGASYAVDGERTVYALGEPQVATFKGQAVHGGGSCQFALSADIEPTKESSWMVIHSVEGGCPARNQRGNLEGPNQDEYAFTIPEGIAPGEYTFAWIWLARVGGQPEYYMNCAPITVVAAKKKARTKRAAWGERRTSSLARRARFPELFMANMGEVSGGCTTGEALNAQVPIRFPNHGDDVVDYAEGKADLFEQPCDGNPRAGSADGGGGGAEKPASSSVGVPSSAAGSPSSFAAVPTDGGGAGSGSAPATTSTVPATTSSVVVTTSPIATPPAQPPASTVAPAPAPAPAPSCAVPVVSTVEVTVTVTATITAEVPAASGVPAAPSTPAAPPPSAGCTEGYLTCLADETHFATCTGGQLTGPQPIAPGFKCRAGEGEGLDISPL